MNPDIMNNPMASLYVGDLPTDVTEAMLFEKFSTAGPVLSVRVFSGYAYVNFLHLADAERALDEMNFDEIKGRQMRISWLQRDSSLRKSGVGNIFIKDLHPTISNEMLFDTLSAFGNILSCKIVQDKNGTSKGFGYVQFETEEEANLTIEKVNGMLLLQKKVYVERFIPREERDQKLGKKTKQFTNVYINNFGENLTDEQMHYVFQKFGTITSCKIMRTDDGKSKGFGFVTFENPEAAETAIEALNGCPVSACNKYLDPKLQICTDGKDLSEGKPLYVGLAQKRAERQKEVKRRFETLKMDRSQGSNLFIKNFNGTIQDDALFEIFSPFGTITSAKVMMEKGRSKGFGFVCFSTPEEAIKAMTEMNGRIVGSKPLYVALARRKEDRKAHLESQYMQKMANVQMPQMGQFNQPGTSSENFIPTIPAPQRFYGPAQIETNPRWPAQAPVRPGAQGSINPYSWRRTTHRPASRRPDSAMRSNINVPRPISDASTMSGSALGG